MPDDNVRTFGSYEVVTEDLGVLEFSALGPVQNDTATGFSHHGILGAGLDLDDGRAAAACCARALLAAATAHLGDLDHLRVIRRLRVFVAATPDFTDFVPIADAASDVLLMELGRRGAHARSVVGVTSLPFDLPVVIEMTASSRLKT